MSIVILLSILLFSQNNNITALIGFYPPGNPKVNAEQPTTSAILVALTQFKCHPAQGAAVAARPEVNPTRMMFGLNANTECEADITKVRRLLLTGQYVARIQMPDNKWTVASNVFIVKLETGSSNDEVR